MSMRAVVFTIIFASFGLNAHQSQQDELPGFEAYSAPDSKVGTHSEGGARTKDMANLTDATEFDVSFPSIELVDHRNRTIELEQLFSDDRNVVFAFFFSHCVSVCTTITMNLKSLQPDLPANTLIAMISIDPEVDTPELLGNYAKQYQIDDSNWYLLTGENQTIIDLQKDFEAYRGNKMNHTTSLFVKKSHSTSVTEFSSSFAEIPRFLQNDLARAM